MANKNINISKLRQILKMYFYKTGTRTISERTGVSRSTIMKYLERYRYMQTTWEELSLLSDKNLDALFHQPPRWSLLSGRKHFMQFFRMWKNN